MFGQYTQLFGGPRLADARLTGQHDQPTLPGHGFRQVRFQFGQFGLAANKHMANVPSGLGFYHATTTGS